MSTEIEEFCIDYFLFTYPINFFLLNNFSSSFTIACIECPFSLIDTHLNGSKSKQYNLDLPSQLHLQLLDGKTHHADPGCGFNIWPPILQIPRSPIVACFVAFSAKMLIFANSGAYVVLLADVLAGLISSNTVTWYLVVWIGTNQRPFHRSGWVKSLVHFWQKCSYFHWQVLRCLSFWQQMSSLVWLVKILPPGCLDEFKRAQSWIWPKIVRYEGTGNRLFPGCSYYPCL